MRACRVAGVTAVALVGGPLVTGCAGSADPQSSPNRTAPTGGHSRPLRLPESDGMSTLLVRTDYSDDSAWQAAVDAVTAVHDSADDESFGALMQVVEAPELDGLTPEDLALLPRAGYLSLLAVADARTMIDHTIVFVDLSEHNEQVGRTFRAVPREVEPITVNLALANMDFFDFADAADPDGVFRGFAAPEPEA